MRREWVFGAVVLGAVVLPLPFAIRCIAILATLAVELTLAESWSERRAAVLGTGAALVVISPVEPWLSAISAVAALAWFGRVLWIAERVRRAHKRMGRAAPA